MITKNSLNTHYFYEYLYNYKKNSLRAERVNLRWKYSGYPCHLFKKCCCNIHSKWSGKKIGKWRWLRPVSRPLVQTSLAWAAPFVLLLCFYLSKRERRVHGLKRNISGWTWNMFSLMNDVSIDQNFWSLATGGEERCHVHFECSTVNTLPL